MNKSLFITFFISYSAFGFNFFGDKNFKDLADRMTQKFNVPTVSAAQLKKEQKSVLIFDAREDKEFKVSHLPGAQHVGYKKFEAKKALKNVNKNQKIIVYCTVGYRSGSITSKLRKLGYNAHNLHGGITSWVNEGGQLLDQNNKPTQRVHTHHKKTAKWFKKGELIN